MLYFHKMFLVHYYVTIRKSMLLIISLCSLIQVEIEVSLLINSCCIECREENSRGTGNQVQRGEQKDEKALEQRGLLHMNKTM